MNSWTRVVRHNWNLTWFRELGTLYLPDWEDAEASGLRDECEEIGLPMGFGRVGRAPVQLDDGEACGQFLGH